MAGKGETFAKQRRSAAASRKKAADKKKAGGSTAAAAGKIKSLTAMIRRDKSIGKAEQDRMIKSITRSRTKSQAKKANYADEG